VSAFLDRHSCTPGVLTAEVTGPLEHCDLLTITYLLYLSCRYSLALSAKPFRVSGPTVWNSLPNSCKQAELVTTFKRKLKSELFHLAYTVNSLLFIVSSHRHKAPLIRSRRTALYKFATD